MLLLALAAMAAQCAPPQILDATTGRAAGLLAGPLAQIAVGNTAMGGERTAYAQAIVARTPAPLCPTRLVFDGSSTRIETASGVTGIMVTLWPQRPRERWVMRNNRYVNETPPLPGREEIEARWAAAYVAALGRLTTVR